MFDSFDTAVPAVEIMAGMLSTMKVNPGPMYRACEEGYINATDCADYLARRAGPSGKPIRRPGRSFPNIGMGITLSEYPLEKYRDQDPLFAEDIYTAIKIETSLYQRNTFGGPAPDSVMVQIQHAEQKLRS